MLILSGSDQHEKISHSMISKTPFAIISRSEITIARSEGEHEHGQQVTPGKSTLNVY